MTARRWTARRRGQLDPLIARPHSVRQPHAGPPAGRDAAAGGVSNTLLSTAAPPSPGARLELPRSSSSLVGAGPEVDLDRGSAAHHQGVPVQLAGDRGELVSIDRDAQRTHQLPLHPHAPRARGRDRDGAAQTSGGAEYEPAASRAPAGGTAAVAKRHLQDLRRTRHRQRRSVGGLRRTCEPAQADALLFSVTPQSNVSSRGDALRGRRCQTS